MAKVLLVEDDNNLREIFEMRLQAEGYDTMTAADGEEALTVAVKQKPDLIIADVMMPKLSGFEMLETLRATPDMGDTKVIMMTALGQAEDRARGEKLGVVKYLVKSQVTLEDFVRVVQEVLGPGGKTKDQSEDSSDNKGTIKNKDDKESEKSMQDDTNAPTNPTTPPADGSAPADNPMGGSGQMSTADEQKTVDDQVNNFASSPAASDGADATGAPEPPASTGPADGGTDAPAPPPADAGGTDDQSGGGAPA